MSGWYRNQDGAGGWVAIILIGVILAVGILFCNGAIEKLLVTTGGV